MGLRKGKLMPAIVTQTAPKHEISFKQTIGPAQPHRISGKQTIKPASNTHTGVSATQKTGKRTNGWTPERRMRQAEAIRRWRPWARSTGPRTQAGKEACSRNAYKHGLRSAASRDLLKTLSRWRAFRRLAVRAVEARLHPDDLAILLRQIQTAARSAGKNFQYQARQDHGTLGGLGVKSCLLPAAAQLRN